ncbi:MAG: hypothetical protein JWO93_2729 [Micrococcaceae bacterium]|jgi:uncharacterized protein (TIGR03089 family)|nr:hypothetical protein [Micrococcaceae bacterium]
MPQPLAELLKLLRSQDSSSPRLTWYGPDGERVELSGRVLDNWVAKTSNFLVDELDAEPGTRLLLDLPAHWRSFSIALAAWQVGCTVTFPAEVASAGAPGASPAGPHITLTSRPEQAEGSGTVVAVALPALAMRWPAQLPAGALDYAAEVRAHGDAFVPMTEVPASTAAILRADGTVIAFADLLSAFAAPTEAGKRVLVPAGNLAESLSAALGVWQQAGSVVLVHPDIPVTDHLVSMEQITGP